MHYCRVILFFIFYLLLTTCYAQSDKFDFIALADIHFDPFTNCVGKKPCPLIEKLRNSTAGQWPAILVQYDIKPQEFKKDTGYRLLTSSMTAIKQVANTSHPQFMFVLGDSLGHEYRAKYKRYSSDASASGYQSFAHKTFEFLAKLIATNFPDTDIYTATGNHDSYQGSYYTKTSGQFFADQAVLWSSLIKDPSNQIAMQKQFSYAGYYSLVLSNPKNLRLIMLNTNLFSYKAKGKNLDAIATQELNWLHAQLQIAKNAHQRVFITMHIPQGIDIYATTHTKLFTLIRLWKPPYIQRFETELKQFSPEVAGIFAGHLHRNQFQILTYDEHEIPVINVTSISPIFGNQPGFRNITYFTNPIHLDDVATYSFPIGGGNAMASNDEKKDFIRGTSI